MIKKISQVIFFILGAAIGGNCSDQTPQEIEAEAARLQKEIEKLAFVPGQEVYHGAVEPILNRYTGSLASEEMMDAREFVAGRMGDFLIPTQYVYNTKPHPKYGWRNNFWTHGVTGDVNITDIRSAAPELWAFLTDAPKNSGEKYRIDFADTQGLDCTIARSVKESGKNYRGVLLIKLFAGLDEDNNLKNFSICSEISILFFYGVSNIQHYIPKIKLVRSPKYRAYGNLNLEVGLTSYFWFANAMRPSLYTSKFGGSKPAQSLSGLSRADFLKAIDDEYRRRITR